MSVFPFALVRRTTAPDRAAPDRGPTAWPWLLATVVVVAVDVAAATVLFALHFPAAAVISLVGGASGVAVTTVGYVHQMLDKGAAVLPAPPGSVK